MSTDLTGQLRAVQYLRAIAAILVTIAHASEEARYFFSFTPAFETNAFGKGVDLFFVISGFIIYYSSGKLFDRSDAGRRFAKNRAIRVIPLYFLATTLMVAVVILLPSGVKEARFDIEQILSSYTFIPFARPDGRIAPILSLGWTLNYEIFFYLLFSLCMAAPGRFVGYLAVGVITALATAGAFVPADAPSPVRAWTHDIILEFGMGIIISMLFTRYGKRWASLLPAIIVTSVGFALLYYLNTPPKPLELPRAVTAGLPAAMIVAAAVLMLPERIEGALPEFGVALGDSSYSLYLSHRFIQRPIQIILTKFPPVSAGYLGEVYLTLSVIGAVAFGHLVYLIVERPLLRWMRRKTSQKKQPDPHALTSVPLGKEA